ncbi:nucleotide-binding universal stress UspA family protein [Peribacillus deserti]|uniref:Nucleotide-binding universal stress UspA family protein n=1 Tax=Peribacillus deserti TaxID=673318 RepID=A0ABS2QLT9_9BACI|nr:universal stress protein [Peribacillus deserti]MBM7694142.1 nucleotide-binding universal stress UspA family protein [Peribacillus deserti]
MNLFRHIAVAYDGTNEGKEAVKIAAGLKKANPETSLTVLHVYDGSARSSSEGAFAMGRENVYVDPTQMQPVVTPPISFENSGFQPYNPEISDPITETETTVKETLGPALADARLEVLDGNPSESICRYAEENNVDLLVVGSSGKSPLKKFFAGSVSEGIVKDAPCSVLIAKGM